MASACGSCNANQPIGFHARPPNAQLQCNPFRSLDLNRGQQLDFCCGFCCRSLTIVKSKWNDFSQNFSYSLMEGCFCLLRAIYLCCSHWSIQVLWYMAEYIYPYYKHIRDSYLCRKRYKKNVCSFFLQNSPSVVNTVLSISVLCRSYTKLLAWIQMNKFFLDTGVVMFPFKGKRGSSVLPVF